MYTSIVVISTTCFDASLAGCTTHRRHEEIRSYHNNSRTHRTRESPRTHKRTSENHQSIRGARNEHKPRRTSKLAVKSKAADSCLDGRDPLCGRDDEGGWGRWACQGGGRRLSEWVTQALRVLPRGCRGWHKTRAYVRIGPPRGPSNHPQDDQ